MSNHTSEANILAHHAGLHGRLRSRRLRSEVLGLRKPYYVYEPPGYREAQQLPMVYLLRGHQREWVNMREDPSRQLATAIQDLDLLIHRQELPPMLAVLPGLSSSNNHIPTLGVDMQGRWPATMQGVGTGRYWTFFTEELIPRLDHLYPQARGGSRMVAGFSLGGYTASLLALHFPGYFDHVAIYDGTLMWPGSQDPRRKGVDPVWSRHPLFNAALGAAPRQPLQLARWNPTDTLQTADPLLLASLRNTRFWVASADYDGQRGNRVRCDYYRTLLQDLGIPIGFDKTVFAKHAAHNWHWMDRFFIEVLRRAYGQTVSINV